MVLPSSRLGLGPWTSSSPSSSDSRICCTWNHHPTRLRNRLRKVKPQDRDRASTTGSELLRGSAVTAAPAPLETTASRPHTTALSPPLLPTFLHFSRLFVSSFSSLSFAQRAQAPGTPFPPPPIQFAL